MKIKTKNFAKTPWGLAIVSAITFVILAFWWSKSLNIAGLLNHPSPRYNVLVVSACSLRQDRIGTFNPKSKLSPKIDEWAKNGFKFTEAIAERPWQNFNYEASAIINRDFLAKLGYRRFRRANRRGYQFVIPPAARTEDSEAWYWGEDSILHFQESFDELRSMLTKPNQRPFYAFVHLKYMHYPYLDSHNLTEKDWDRLTPQSRKLLEQYRRHPERYEDQLPLISVLLNDFTFLKKKFKLQGDILSTAGVVSDPIRNSRWSKSKNFQADLQLVGELYDLKMSIFDDMAIQVLNLFDDEDLRRNTIIIFTGDHGEAHMEHGILGHSVNVYDDMLRYPLVVKFPAQKEGQTINGQVNHRIVAGWVKELLSGDLRADNFTTKVNAEAAEFLLARNCSNTIQTIRTNRWKLIKNLDSAKDELYDLQNDPQERINLIETNPEIAFALEEKLIERQHDLLTTNPKEIQSKVCMPR